MRHTCSRSGNSILEAVVAVSILVVALVGIMQLTARSLKANELVADHFIAAQLAGEGIELVRNFLDGKQTDGVQWKDLEGYLFTGAYEMSADTLTTPVRKGDLFWRSITKLTFDSIGPIYSYTYGDETKFTRTILVEWGDECTTLSGTEYASVTVRSIVSWLARGESVTSTVADRFASWRGIPACSGGI